MPVKPISQLIGLGSRLYQSGKSTAWRPSLGVARVSVGGKAVFDAVASLPSPSVVRVNRAEEPVLLRAVVRKDPTGSATVENNEFMTWLYETFARAHGLEIAAMASKNPKVEALLPESTFPVRVQETPAPAAPATVVEPVKMKPKRPKPTPPTPPPAQPNEPVPPGHGNGNGSSGPGNGNNDPVISEVTLPSLPPVVVPPVVVPPGHGNGNASPGPGNGNGSSGSGNGNGSSGPGNGNNDPVTLPPVPPVVVPPVVVPPVVLPPGSNVPTPTSVKDAIERLSEYLQRRIDPKTAQWLLSVLRDLQKKYALPVVAPPAVKPPVGNVPTPTAVKDVVERLAAYLPSRDWTEDPKTAQWLSSTLRDLQRKYQR